MRGSDIYVSFSSGFQQSFAGFTKLYEHVSQRTYYCINHPWNIVAKQTSCCSVFVHSFPQLWITSQWTSVVRESRTSFEKNVSDTIFGVPNFHFMELMISLTIAVVINFIQAYMSNRNCYYLSYEKWSVNSFSIRWTVIKELTTHRKDLLVSFYELLVCYLLV